MGVNNINNNRAAYDPKVAQELRNQLKSNSPQAAKAAAAQFEAMFLQQVFKSMRDTVPQDGLISGGDGAQIYKGLLDQQMAQNLSSVKGGVGFAKQIEDQLTRQMGADSKSYPAGTKVPKIDNDQLLQNLISNTRAGSLNRNLNPSIDGKTPLNGLENKPQNNVNNQLIFQRPPLKPLGNNPNTTVENKPTSSIENSNLSSKTKFTPNDFAQKMLGFASEASDKTGIPAQFLVGHAALESAWGNSVPKGSNGEQSYNLFGIKAGKNWTGKTVDVVTTEYVDGQPQKVVQKFRAYDSFQESFNDYASLLSNSSRYANVIGTQDPAKFAWGLQNSGYATDPSYAKKLAQVITSPRLNKAVQLASIENQTQNS